MSAASSSYPSLFVCLLFKTMCMISLVFFKNGGHSDLIALDNKRSSLLKRGRLETGL